MKTIHLRCATARQATLVVILFLTGLNLRAQLPPGVRSLPSRNRAAATNTAAGGALSPLPQLPPPALPTRNMTPASPSASLAMPSLPDATVSVPAANVPGAASRVQKEEPGYTFQYEGVDVNQVLDVYANLVNKTLIRGNIPSASIVLKTQTKLTKTEAIHALEAVLALNNISVIPMDDKFVKVVSTDQAGSAAAPFNVGDPADLPNLGSYVTQIVPLQYVKPSVMQPIIAPLAKINNIIAIDDNGLLVIRDYAENVKRMLELIKQIDISSPQEYTNEVIEIKYALAEDIANALNSLGGTGGASTVAIGASPSSTSISGIASPGRTGGGGGGTTFGNGGTATPYNGQRTTFGAQSTATPNGTPTGGTTFQGRLGALLAAAANRPGGGGANGQQDQIQVFGQAKIIADARANSLLVFATRADMERIKAVVSKLDVLLSQVLVEAVIIDYALGPNTLNYGVSAAQNPKVFHGSSSNILQNIIGGGGMNNGPSFLNFLTQGIGTNVSSGVFGNSLGSGFSYFGNIGPTWDVAVQAAETDSHASIIQRPRVQTSQAKPAQFFVGETVPYVTGTSFGTGINGASTSTYSQLSVGVELDVTPFINPDGLVVMDINQEIDDLDGSTPIEGVGNVPNTVKRTISSEIAVKDRDTVMLGGFIKNQKSTAKSGIPILMNIPILGALFSSHSDSKQREELIVMMRPTVLRTPEIAAQQTLVEEQRLPGVSAAEAENDADEAKRVADERKAELKRTKIRNENNGFFTPPPPPATVDTNIALPLP